MKCKYCGGNIGLEDKFCPYCGKPNELAQQHVRDMRQYSDEFAETKRDVYRTTNLFSGAVVRVIILAVLIVAIVAVLYLTENAYSFARDAKERDARRNAATYTKQIDDMLAEEDYRGIANFAEAHYINSWLSEYEAYEQIIVASKMYTRAVQYLMNAQFAGSAEVYAGEEYLLNKVGFFASTLSDFYVQTDPAQFGSGIDVQKSEQTIAGMRENLNALMKAYLGLTEEEIREQEPMTEERRILFFQEKYAALHSAKHEDAAVGE